MNRLVDVGDEVKDQVTGFKGIAVARANYLYGCVRVEVQPQTLQKDKTATPSSVFDETQLVVVTKGKVKSPKIRARSDIAPGDEVKDAITGVKGIVNTITEFVFSGPRITIQPQKLEDGLPVDAYYVDQNQVILVKPAKVVPADKAKKAIETKKSTGGPSRNDKAVHIREVK